MHAWHALKTQHKHIYASTHTHTNENTRMHVETQHTYMDGQA